MNIVSIIGRITHPLELKQTPNGKSVCSFSVAVERKFKDAEGNAIVDYVDCVAWNNTADFLCKWFDKGVRVGLTGELQTRTYTDNDNKNRKVTEVLVSTVEFADGKREANAVTETTNTNTSNNPFDNDGFIPLSDDETLPF